MLRKWMLDVAGAREVASDVRAYLVSLADRMGDRGWLYVSGADALEEARRLGRYRRGRACVVDGVFQCACGAEHPLADAVLDCECGARYQASWAGEGWCVVEGK